MGLAPAPDEPIFASITILLVSTRPLPTMGARLKIDVKRRSSGALSSLLKGDDFCVELPCPHMVTFPHHSIVLDQDCSYYGIGGSSSPPLFRQTEDLFHPLLIRHQPIPFRQNRKTGWRVTISSKIRNPNIEIPASAEAASRRQAKQWPKFKSQMIETCSF